MKNKVLFAALAVLAMASCTTIEQKVPSTGTDAVISFFPLVANAPKKNFRFAVFAWHAEPRLSDSTTKVVKYMDNVPVTYTFDTSGIGEFKPQSTYYWPKNGTLSFDAYAPVSAHNATNPGKGEGIFSSESDKGLQIKSYKVADIADQYDLLYSERTLNKKASTEGSIDGVYIAFKHALAAIAVTAKTNEDYSDAIKLTKITILKAYGTGEFNQNMSDGYTPGNPEWTAVSTEVDYVLFEKANGVALTETELSSNAILLPQRLDHDNNKVSIKVDYTIKCDGGDLAQTQTFELTPRSGSEESGASATLTSWEMGKKYTYNFIFSLEEVFFAPSVAEWSDVAVFANNVN